MPAWLGRLSNLLPIGVAAVAVLLTVVGVHLTTLSQQATIGDARASVYSYSTGADLSASGEKVRVDGGDIQEGLFASGALCPIHSFGLFGTGTK